MSEVNVTELANKASQQTVEFVIENLGIGSDNDSPELAEAMVNCLTMTVAYLILYLKEVLPEPNCHNVMALITGIVDRIYAKTHPKEDTNGGHE